MRSEYMRASVEYLMANGEEARRRRAARAVRRELDLAPAHHTRGRQANPNKAESALTAKSEVPKIVIQAFSRK
jgi:hypothetical protein